MATRRQTFRLYPNKKQEKALFDSRCLHCYLYNACIANRRYEWKANKKSVSYLQQQNCLPEFKKEWPEFAYLHSQSLQATVKRVDLAYNSFFKRLRGLPKFKPIRNYSGWTYPAKSGWKVHSEGKHGTITLNDLGITLKMRGRAKNWGIPTTLTIVYKLSKRQWFASLTVEVAVPTCKLGNESALTYESLIAFDLGTQTPLTLYDGKEFTEVSNPRFTQKNVATNQQRMLLDTFLLRNGARSIRLGLGTSLTDCGCFSSTDSTSKRKHTGSMKQLGQMKRQKSQSKKAGKLETPSSYEAG